MTKPKHYSTFVVEKGDSTGAGDIHRGTFVASVLSGKSIDIAFEIATNIASKSVSCIGVDDSIRFALSLLKK